MNNNNRNLLFCIGLLGASTLSLGEDVLLWRCGNVFTNDKVEAELKGCKPVQMDPVLTKQLDKAFEEKMRARRQKAPRSPAPLPSSSTSQKLRELDGLRRDGVITQSDFESKKQEILKRY